MTEFDTDILEIFINAFYAIGAIGALLALAAIFILLRGDRPTPVGTTATGLPTLEVGTPELSHAA